MHTKTWLLAAAMALACSPALAVDQVGYQVGNGNPNTQAVSPQTPLPTTCISGCSSPTIPSNLATAQVSVATTATQIVATRSGRGLVTIVNTTTTDIYIGGSSVTTSTGLLLPGTKGASLTLSDTAAFYGVVASGTATVTALETY